MFAPPGSKPKPVSRIMFDKFDKDKSGTIDAEEFKALCFDLGHFLTADQLDFAIKALDKDGNNKISYDEFQGWWGQQDRFKNIEVDETKLSKLKGYLELFRKFDADGSGQLDKDEFAAFHKEMVKQKKTKHSLQVFEEDLDINSSGTITFNELSEWLLRKEI